MSVSEVQNTSCMPCLHPKNPITPEMKGRALTHIKRLEIIIQGLVILSLVLLAASVVFIGLASASYAHPYIALYTFSGSIGGFFVMKVINSFQDCIAKRNKIELEKDYYPVMQPIPKKETKRKN